MGMNYYTETYYMGIPICRHIGKNSAGWPFVFARYSDLNSAKDWFDYIDRDDVVLLDEYGDERKPHVFRKIVEVKQEQLKDIAPKACIPSKHYTVDEEGYVFFESDPDDWC